MIPQGPFSQFHQQRWIEAKNDGSTTIPAFGICQITGSARPDTSSTETPDGGRTSLTVQVPDSSTYLLDFAINGHVPIAAGKYGYVTQQYPCYVAYNTAQTPAYGDEWGVAASSSLVVKNRPGLLILGDTNGTIVRVDKTSLTKLVGKPDSDISKGSSGTVSAWMRNASTGTWEDSTYNVTATALFADVVSGLYTSLFWNCGVWIVRPEEC